MKSSFLLIFVICALYTPSIRSHILVRRRYTDQLIEEFYDLPALFGDPIPSTGLRVYPLGASPIDGCDTQPTPHQQIPFGPINNRKFVLIIARNNCTFEEKIRNAQNAQYDAAIVYNIGSDDLEQMSAKNSTGIKIPAVFIGESSGNYIKDYYLNQSEYVLIINDALPFNINKNLIIPFSVLVGLCFFVMILYMIYKCIREQRRLNQHRLPKRLLKKIQVVKFSEGLPYESCIICLEEYSKGERIRVLPCKHAYHCHCIDVWLTKNRRVCPICKRRVFVRSETRNQTRRRHYSSDSNTDTDDDVQPLISSLNPNDHGTFPQNNQNDNNGNETNTNNQRNQERPTTDDEDNVLNSAESASGTQNNSSNSRRENPFNRNSGLNEAPIVEQNANEERSFWNFFKFRLFRRSDSLTTPLFNEIESPFTTTQTNSNRLGTHEVPSPTTVNVATSPSTASNNILNTNLSGSFQDNTVATTTSAPSSLTTVQISNSKEKNKSKSSKRNKKDIGSISNSRQQPSTSSIPTSSISLTQEPTVQNSNTEADVFIATPSQGGIGVAALPNTDLNPDQRNQSSSTNNRHNYFNL
ncbi:E3 ubiquitin-protein ligase Godzilla [Condylostylus longicornis]|uniref:E3 ubiquitin-protein ligase Godzilla n=1 Tax=Condylostylus longicornis TaxID=2530218 RepID=UPI00244E03A3|nr:E3 ubiquitin-protein ligase Godzilla [Condylostylus longicornis]XP_055375017.1 E3 ubiquitin-protein ligase Godzilla [Condylostylus longicornis]